MSSNDQSIEASTAAINSHQAKTGSGPQSDSTVDSGVNENVTSQFPGSKVQVGGTKRGENPTIPDEEGGEQSKTTGRQTKADDFGGVGGPEDKVKQAETDRPGDDDVTGNVRS